MGIDDVADEYFWMTRFHGTIIIASIANQHHAWALFINVFIFNPDMDK